MRKKMTFCFIFIAVIMLFSSCSPGPAASASQTPEPTATATAAPSATATSAPTPGEGGVITVYCYSDEIVKIIEKYIELHPDFRYTVNYPLGPMYEGLYQPALDQALTAGIPGTPDIYCVDSIFVTRYIQGEMSGYAMPYKDLVTGFDAKMADAQIASYIVDVGTRPSDNAVVGLAYQSTGGAFIYRRSIAKDVWGTDEPSAIASKIGPGWDRFFAAAEELKQKGYAIVSGDGDIWHSVASNAEQGWVVNGKLTIDPKREAFLDYAKQLSDNGYSNGTQDWKDAWYADMAGSGEKPVFGYFGPAWLINYVMAHHSGATFNDDGTLAEAGGTYGDWAVCMPTVGFFWGGTWVLANKELDNDLGKKAAVAELIDWITLQCDENSLQYLWANGAVFDSGNRKDTVASGTVMATVDGALDFLGGQNMFDVYNPASQNINGNNLSPYDNAIDTIWREQVKKYVDGECTRDEAIAAFKQEVTDQLQLNALPVSAH